MGEPSKVKAYLLSFAVIVALNVTLPAKANTDRGTCPEGYKPRLLSLESDGIDLEKAVGVTIGNNPNVCLRQTDADRQAGIALELSGDFDWVFSGELSYQHEEQELPESVKRREQDRRDDLTILNGESCSAISIQEQKIRELEAAIRAGGGVPIEADPDFQRILDIIEQAIAEAGPEALPSLISQRQITLQDELIETREVLAASRETCQVTGEELARLGEVPEIQETDAARLDLRLGRLFRNGILFEPFLEGAYERVQYEGKRNGFFEPVLDENGQQVVEFGVERERFIDFGGTNQPPLYTFRVGFDVDIPLLRGRGREATGAAERAARLDHEAAESLVRHSVADAVLSTITAFWDTLAAQERVKYLQGSAADRGELTTSTARLNKAGEASDAELARARAGEAGVRAQLSTAKRELIAARAALLEALGTDAESITHLPTVKGGFPPGIARGELDELISSSQLLAAAILRRDDLAAARLLVESAEIRAESARLDLRPLLDLSAGTWATAVGESDLSEAVDRFVTPSFQLALAFEKPLGNNERSGRSAQAAAVSEQNRIRSADAERGVRLTVIATLHALGEAADRLAQARAAENDARKVQESQFRLYKNQEVDLLDSLATEQQYLQARLDRVEAERELAVLLARLRFASGTLITDPAKPSVTFETVTTLPRLESAGVGR